jgi:hypothetical protein
MANLTGFDANQIEPTTDFEPVPAGKYLAMITDSEEKPTKSGTGSYLQLTFEILEGPYKGRFLWSRLNLENSNTTTVQIAKRELSSICRSIGVMTPTDSIELHNLPMMITVKCKKRDDTGDVLNEIKGYSKKESVKGQSSQTASNSPPWRRPA